MPRGASLSSKPLPCPASWSAAGCRCALAVAASGWRSGRRSNAVSAGSPCPRFDFKQVPSALLQLELYRGTAELVVHERDRALAAATTFVEQAQLQQHVHASRRHRSGGWKQETRVRHRVQRTTRAQARIAFAERRASPGLRGLCFKGVREVRRVTARCSLTPRRFVAVSFRAGFPRVILRRRWPLWPAPRSITASDFAVSSSSAAAARPAVSVPPATTTALRQLRASAPRPGGGSPRPAPRSITTSDFAAISSRRGCGPDRLRAVRVSLPPRAPFPGERADEYRKGSRVGCPLSDSSLVAPVERGLAASVGEASLCAVRTNCASGALHQHPLGTLEAVCGCAHGRELNRQRHAVDPAAQAWQ